MGLCTNQPANNYYINCYPLNIYSYLCAQISTMEKGGAARPDSSCELVFFCFAHDGLPQLVTYGDGMRMTAHGQT